MYTAELIDKLSAAQQLLRDGGWSQGVAKTQDGEHCLGGAMADVCGLDPNNACFCGQIELDHGTSKFTAINEDFAQMCKVALNHIKATVGHAYSIQFFNDWEAKTFKDVDDFMTSLIGKLNGGSNVIHQ